jgi:hypothetical protein
MKSIKKFNAKKIKFKGSIHGGTSFRECWESTGCVGGQSDTYHLVSGDDGTFLFSYMEYQSCDIAT